MRQVRLGWALRKKIILLADGTGNAASSIWRSNVWRIFKTLDRSGDQMILYDDGLGTSRFLPTAMFGRMFGRGLRAKVLHFYEFLCRNYNEGDEIFAFGFSRGAFTIRTVIGLVTTQGLARFSSEAELRRKAKEAYRAHRTGWSTAALYNIASAFRRLNDRLRGHAYDRSEYRPISDIRFVGLWDTVAAYGLPVEEMTRGISRWLWPLSLPDRSLTPIVRRACHALSLDDERTTFQPFLWDETREHRPQPNADGRRYTNDERISQVWFSGAHANVGGGYPERLARPRLALLDDARGTPVGLAIKIFPRRRSGCISKSAVDAG